VLRQLADIRITPNIHYTWYHNLRNVMSLQVQGGSHWAFDRLRFQVTVFNLQALRIRQFPKMYSSQSTWRFGHCLPPYGWIIWFFKSSNWIWTRDLPNASQLLYPLSFLCCGFGWNAPQVFSTSSSSTPTLTHDDKLGWWVYGVRQLICWCQQSREIYQCDGWTDRQTAFQFYIYIE